MMAMDMVECDRCGQIRLCKKIAGEWSCAICSPVFIERQTKIITDMIDKSDTDVSKINKGFLGDGI